MLEEKMCLRCKLPKLLKEFYKKSASKDGRQSYCKECNKLASIKWQKKHPEKARATVYRWRKKHPEEAKAATRTWRKENLEKTKATDRVRYKKHTEKRKAAVRRWQKENPKKVKVAVDKWRKKNPEKPREYGRRRRARKFDVGENFTAELEQFVYTFWNNKCAVCGLTDQLAIDHWRPLSKGFALDAGNAVVMCRKCNSSKSNKLPHEIYSPLFIQDTEFKLYKQADAWEEE